MMTKAEQKRAEIIAKQAAREVADAAARHGGGAENPGAGDGKRRRTFAFAPPFAGGARRGRPPRS